MTVLKIIRDEWARGGNNGLSSLLNDDGNKCCLGFAALQITGLTENQIRGYREFSEFPSELFDKLDTDGAPFCEVYEGEYSYDNTIENTIFHDQAIKINDYRLGSLVYADIFTIKSEADREKLLIELFKEYGIKVQFE